MLGLYSMVMLLGDWEGPGWWIVFVPLGWLLVLVAFFVLLRAFVFRGGVGPGSWGGGGEGRRAPPSADEVLRRRFADGEISADEYRERRAVLEERPGPGRAAPEGFDAAG